MAGAPGRTGGGRGGLAYASTALQAKGYTCPVTGETLLCEKCCPLYGEKAARTELKAPEPKTEADADYICAITGEKLG